MRRMIGSLITAAMLLSLCACWNNTSTQLQNGSPTNNNSLIGDKASESSPTTIAPAPSEDGILGLYLGDLNYETQRYNRFVLAWINPETGDTNKYREFHTDDENVIIDPKFVLQDHTTTGKNILRQMFDSSYERVIAKNISDNSWGWVDTDGKYTDVTSFIQAPDGFAEIVNGVGFHNDYYYICAKLIPSDLYVQRADLERRFLSETNSGTSFTDEGQELARQYLSVQSEVSQVVEYKMLKIPVEEYDSGRYEEIVIHLSDIIDEPDFLGYNYLIQSDAKSEMACVSDAGRLDLACPVFYDELNGACVPGGYYGDWLSSQKCLYSDNFGRIGLSESIILGDRSLFDLNPDSGSRLLYQFEEGKELLIDENDYDFRCPILSQNKDCFAAVVWVVQNNDGSSSTHIDHLGIFDLSGDEISIINSATVEAGSSKYGFPQKILDWTGPYSAIVHTVDLNSWLGTWSSSSGEYFEITSISETGLSVHFTHFTEEGMGTFDYELEFDNTRKTIASEIGLPEDHGGWEYTFELNDDQITVKSRYPENYFHKIDPSLALGNKLGFVREDSSNPISEMDIINISHNLMGLDFYSFNGYELLYIDEVSVSALEDAVATLVSRGCSTVVFDIGDLDLYGNYRETMLSNYPGTEILPIISSSQEFASSSLDDLISRYTLNGTIDIERMLVSEFGASIYTVRLTADTSMRYIECGSLSFEYGGFISYSDGFVSIPDTLLVITDHLQQRPIDVSGEYHVSFLGCSQMSKSDIEALYNAVSNGDLSGFVDYSNP